MYLLFDAVFFTKYFLKRRWFQNFPWNNFQNCESSFFQFACPLIESSPQNFTWWPFKKTKEFIYVNIFFIYIIWRNTGIIILHIGIVSIRHKISILSPNYKELSFFFLIYHSVLQLEFGRNRGTCSFLRRSSHSLLP